MKDHLTTKLSGLIVAGSLLFCVPFTGAQVRDEEAPPESGVDTRKVLIEPGFFRPDPDYADQAYDATAQIGIYGSKYPVVSTRPWLELGRDLYREGPFSPSPSTLGRKNRIFQHFYAYGDWRNAVGINDGGTEETRHGTLATRLNLDLDYQFTATERIHAFFRPFERRGDVTRLDFLNTPTEGHAHFNASPVSLFFEGDAGRILEGFSGQNNSIDLPIAGGLMPMVVQNGVWMASAFTGAAITIPARNSSLFKISNMDFTFFVGVDQVNTPAIKPDAGTFGADLYGVAAFIEANQGYWEVDYGYTAVDAHFRGLEYHNVSVSFTRRYFERVSNSLRVIGNFGQDPAPGENKTAEGVLFLMENSFVTPDELSLVPYANFFLGIESPQSLARDAGAGGVLVNTGLNFETDGLTGFPKLDDTGHDTYGGALGLEYLFNLNQQIVVEVATVQILNDSVTTGRTAKGPQYALGIRYQIPLSRSWIFRTDGILATRENDTDLAGVRMELRYKF